MYHFLYNVFNMMNLFQKKTNEEGGLVREEAAKFMIES